MNSTTESVEITPKGIRKVLNKYTPQRAIAEYICVALPKNRTVEKWTRNNIFVTPKTERDEEVKTFRQRKG